MSYNFVFLEVTRMYNTILNANIYTLSKYEHILSRRYILSQSAVVFLIKLHFSVSYPTRVELHVRGSYRANRRFLVALLVTQYTATATQTAVRQHASLPREYTREHNVSVITGSFLPPPKRMHCARPWKFRISNIISCSSSPICWTHRWLGVFKDSSWYVLLQGNFTKKNIATYVWHEKNATFAMHIFLTQPVSDFPMVARWDTPFPIQNPNRYERWQFRPR